MSLNTGDVGWFGLDDGASNVVPRRAEVVYVFHPTPTSTVVYCHVHVCTADDAMLDPSEQIVNQPQHALGLGIPRLLLERQCPDAGTTPTVGAFWQ